MGESRQGELRHNKPQRAALALVAGVRKARELGAKEWPVAKRTLSRWLVWSPILSAVAVVLLLSSFVIDRALHMHRVLRGVWVARLALSGLGPAKAAQAVQQLGARLEKAPLRVRIHRQLFELDPASIGMKINVDETVRQALRAGRTGSWSAQLLWWLGRWARGHQVEASVTYDLKALEQTLHAWETQAITDLPSTGGVVVEAGEPLAVYPRPGRLVLPEEAFRLIARGLGRERRDLVEIPTALVESKVEPGSVDRAVRRAKELLGNSATMRWQTAQGTEERLEFRAEELAKSLRSRVDAKGSDLELYFDQAFIEKKLEPIRRSVEVAPLEAGFDIDWLNRIQVTEARPGTLIDLEVLGRLLVQAVENRRALFELPLRRNVEPGFSTEQAKALNIKGLVAQFTTHHPCCQDRVKNIHRIADLVSGSIIKPGETFSLNQLVGLRTADRGFVSAPSIEDGETVDALGGGISQFTTTLFNAAYLGGCELLEWQPHTYWFSRYPMGHEATLSWPKPDLVFRNDFRSGLLIRTAYTPTSITVRLFGDNTDRRVKVDVSPRRDITEPAVELIPNPKLSPEREKVTERGEVGWSVQVTRTVTFTDRAARNEERRVTYKPRPRRIQVHPCRIPRGDPSYTGEPCPVPSDSFEPETPDTAGTEAGER